MKYFKKISLLFLGIGSAMLVFSWGAWGHKHINRAAVFALPAPMQVFYYNHIDYITESAVVPDLRRPLINDKNEGPRHYIDIEDFGKMPLSDFPKTTAEAYKKYDSAFLNKTGYLPWYIQNMTQKLTDAFRKRNKSEILFLSGELAHYVADAHMPLHTSSNHNGQLTNQTGVHALWESMLPQMFGDSYNFHTPPAKYLSDIPTATWQMIAQSHALVDTVLMAEMSVRNKIPQAERYKKDSQGNNVLFYNAPVYSDEYAGLFHKALNGMVEKQMRLSITDVASYWYTAWVNAGSPDLLSLDDPHLTKQNRRNYKKELKAWKHGRLLNLSMEKE
ncbi:MAG: zinc dependent phospholipase C family protein [Bacteroidetes bacterium]|nr:zinc dependent phospholipase C family protein [Bacteroidota bacterium]